MDKHIIENKMLDVENVSEVSDATKVYGFDENKNKFDITKIKSMPSFYSGTSNPPSELGEDGDVYFQYEE